VCVWSNKRNVRMTVAWIVSLVAALPVADAASLKPEADKAWEEYIARASASFRERADAPDRVLQIDSLPATAAKVRRGQIVASPAATHIPRKIPSGLIHDWVGTVFIANATVKDVVAVVRDYPKYPEVYAPHVLAARAISAGEATDLFSVVLMNKSVLSKTALDCDYQTTFVHVDERRMYSITQATRIQEIADYGTPRQHTLPVGEGQGLIWRLYSVSLFQERDGGLYVETEAMALSRDIPSALRLIVEPIVRRVSREALETALQQTSKAALTPGATADFTSRTAPPLKPHS
jgi:hypothetical protein